MVIFRQLQARTVLRAGEELLADVFNVPNAHGILEFVDHTLAATLNGNFSSTDVFERLHQEGKTRIHVPSPLCLLRVMVIYVHPYVS